MSETTAFIGTVIVSLLALYGVVYFWVTRYDSVDKGNVKFFKWLLIGIVVYAIGYNLGILF